MRYELSDCEWSVIKPMLPSPRSLPPRVETVKGRIQGERVLERAARDHIGTDTTAAIARGLGEVGVKAVLDAEGGWAALDPRHDNDIAGSPIYKRIRAKVGGGRMQRCFGPEFACKAPCPIEAGGAGGHRGTSGARPPPAGRV